LWATRADRSILIPIEFTPEPLTFSRDLDLAGKIPGLTIDGGGTLEIKVQPDFRITLGVRLKPGLSFDERLFIADDAEPEVAVSLSAKLDDFNITGHLGVLDVTLGEIKTAGGQPDPANDGSPCSRRSGST